MPYSLFPEVETEAMARPSRNIGIGEPGAFDEFGRGTGMAYMKDMAVAGRAVDLLGSVGPIVQDKLTGGTERQDAYFAQHDEIFNRAVDYWTPAPSEVGWAGQMVGSLAGGLVTVIANPALAVASAHLSSAEDLTRSGVDAETANMVGGVQGLTLAAGLRIPFLGKTLMSRMASGAAGFEASSVLGAATSKAILEGAGRPKEAAQFNPWDLKARSLDLLMGLAFGGLAHLDAKGQAAAAKARESIPQDTKDAILVLNQAHHLETASIPGRPASEADLSTSVQAMRTAVDQMLKGEPVDVEGIVRGVKYAPDPMQEKAQAEVGKVMEKAAADVLPNGEPIERAPVLESKAAQEPAGAAQPLGTPTIPAEAGTPKGEATKPEDPLVQTARQIGEDRPDMMVPMVDANGKETQMKVGDFLAHVDEQAKLTNADAGVFRTAITCLLGAL